MEADMSECDLKSPTVATHTSSPSNHSTSSSHDIGDVTSSSKGGQLNVLSGHSSNRIDCNSLSNGCESASPSPNTSNTKSSNKEKSASSIGSSSSEKGLKMKIKRAKTKEGRLEIVKGGHLIHPSNLINNQSHHKSSSKGSSSLKSPSKHSSTGKVSLQSVLHHKGGVSTSSSSSSQHFQAQEMKSSSSKHPHHHLSHKSSSSSSSTSSNSNGGGSLNSAPSTAATKSSSSFSLVKETTNTATPSSKSSENHHRSNVEPFPNENVALAKDSIEEKNGETRDQEDEASLEKANDENPSDEDKRGGAVKDAGSQDFEEICAAKDTTVSNDVNKKEKIDVSVSTSDDLNVGTMTNDQLLGPMQPGDSIALNGIVWHEVDGILIVNVNWRGRTYVGTLLDSTRTSNEWTDSSCYRMSGSDDFSFLSSLSSRRGGGGGSGSIGNVNTSGSQSSSNSKRGGGKRFSSSSFNSHSSSNTFPTLGIGSSMGQSNSSNVSSPSSLSSSLHPIGGLSSPFTSSSSVSSGNPTSRSSQQLISNQLSHSSSTFLPSGWCGNNFGGSTDSSEDGQRKNLRSRSSGGASSSSGQSPAKSSVDLKRKGVDCGGEVMSSVSEDYPSMSLSEDLDGSSVTKKAKVEGGNDINNTDENHKPTPKDHELVSKTPPPLALSPLQDILHCPEKECGKSYRHITGLRYHVSSQHPRFLTQDGEIRTSQDIQREEEEEKKEKERERREREREKQDKGETDQGFTDSFSSSKNWETLEETSNTTNTSSIEESVKKENIDLTNARIGLTTNYSDISDDEGSNLGNSNSTSKLTYQNSNVEMSTPFLSSGNETCSPGGKTSQDKQGGQGSGTVSGGLIMGSGGSDGSSDLLNADGSKSSWLHGSSNQQDSAVLHIPNSSATVATTNANTPLLSSQQQPLIGGLRSSPSITSSNPSQTQISSNISMGSDQIITTSSTRNINPLPLPFSTSSMINQQSTGSTSQHHRSGGGPVDVSGIKREITSTSTSSPHASGGPYLQVKEEFKPPLNPPPHAHGPPTSHSSNMQPPTFHGLKQQQPHPNMIDMKYNPMGGGNLGDSGGGIHHGGGLALGRQGGSGGGGIKRSLTPNSSLASMGASTTSSDPLQLLAGVGPNISGGGASNNNSYQAQMAAAFASDPFFQQLFAVAGGIPPSGIGGGGGPTSSSSSILHSINAAVSSASSSSSPSPHHISSHFATSSSNKQQQNIQQTNAEKQFADLFKASSSIFGGGGGGASSNSGPAPSSSHPSSLLPPPQHHHHHNAPPPHHNTPPHIPWSVSSSSTSLPPHQMPPIHSANSGANSTLNNPFNLHHPPSTNNPSHSQSPNMGGGGGSSSDLGGLNLQKNALEMFAKLSGSGGSSHGIAQLSNSHHPHNPPSSNMHNPNNNPSSNGSMGASTSSTKHALDLIAKSGGLDPKLTLDLLSRPGALDMFSKALGSVGGSMPPSFTPQSGGGGGGGGPSTSSNVPPPQHPSPSSSSSTSSVANMSNSNNAYSNSMLDPKIAFDLFTKSNGANLDAKVALDFLSKSTGSDPKAAIDLLMKFSGGGSASSSPSFPSNHLTDLFTSAMNSQGGMNMSGNKPNTGSNNSKIPENKHHIHNPNVMAPGGGLGGSGISNNPLNFNHPMLNPADLDSNPFIKAAAAALGSNAAAAAAAVAGFTGVGGGSSPSSLPPSLAGSAGGNARRSNQSPKSLNASAKRSTPASGSSTPVSSLKRPPSRGAVKSPIYHHLHMPPLGGGPVGLTGGSHLPTFGGDGGGPPGGHLPEGSGRASSPPLQRHVHTHTHTHFGVPGGFPLPPPQGSAPPPSASAMLVGGGGGPPGGGPINSAGGVAGGPPGGAGSQQQNANPFVGAFASHLLPPPPHHRPPSLPGLPPPPK